MTDGVIGCDADGTFDSRASPCTCHRRLLLHARKKNVIFCPGCGCEIKIMSQKEIDKQEKLKSKHGKNKGKQSFIISQKRKDPTTKTNTFYDEDQRIAGGIITQSDEAWYYPS